MRIAGSQMGGETEGITSGVVTRVGSQIRVTEEVG